MIVPAKEWPANTVGPDIRARTRRTASAASSRVVNGFWTATTFSPFAWSWPMTSDQQEPSANRPCTSTTLRAGVLASGGASAAAGSAAAAAAATEAAITVRRVIVEASFISLDPCGWVRVVSRRRRHRRRWRSRARRRRRRGPRPRRRRRPRGLSARMRKCVPPRQDCAPLRICGHCATALRQRRTPVRSCRMPDRAAQTPMTPRAWCGSRPAVTATARVTTALTAALSICVGLARGPPLRAASTTLARQSQSG